MNATAGKGNICDRAAIFSRTPTAIHEATVEERLLILEQTVSNLQRKIESDSRPSDWLDHLIGSISDEPAFLEALEYGRAFRQSDSADLKADSVTEDQKGHS